MNKVLTALAKIAAEVDPYVDPLPDPIDDPALLTARRNVARWEGFVPQIYNDQQNKAVGFGFNGKQIKDWVRKNGGTMPVVQAWGILNNHLNTSLRDLRTYKGSEKLNANQLAALASLHYNIGAGAFRNGSIGKLLESGQYDKIPGVIAQYNKVRNYKGVLETTPNAKYDKNRGQWYTLVPSKGLTERRGYEVDLWNRPLK